MKTSFYITLLIFLQFLECGNLMAQIPGVISYQGILTDNKGNPKPDGEYNFVFNLYESKTGNSPVWTESKTLLVENGLFSTNLGSQNPLTQSVKFDKPYWLGIKTGTDAELTPRILLTSVAYSFHSLIADTALYAYTGLSDSSWNNNADDLYRLKGKIGIGIIPSQRLHISGGKVLVEGTGNYFEGMHIKNSGRPECFALKRDALPGKYTLRIIKIRKFREWKFMGYKVLGRKPVDIFLAKSGKYYNGSVKS